MELLTLMCFNPRARMGRDPERQGVNIVLKEFQSTRPHGARQINRIIINDKQEVSIHAPAWGATFLGG